MEAHSSNVAEAGISPGALAWHALGEDAVLRLLESTRAGLSQDVATKRLEEYGRNELAQAAPRRPLMLLLGQFKSLIVWILAAAAVVSGLMGERADCIAILSIVAVNGLIGFYQEFNAERSLAALTFCAPHIAWLGAFLAVEPMPTHHCLLLLVLGAIPLLALEGWKLIRRRKEAAR